MFIIVISLMALPNKKKVDPRRKEEKKQVPLCMAPENVELVHEFCPQHWRVGTAGIK